VTDYYATINCCKCHLPFGVLPHMQERLKKHGGSFWCPGCGVAQHFTQTELDTLRAERDRLKQQIAQRDDHLAEARKVLAKERKAAARVKWRVGAGVCACCHRTFANMAQHMKSKHPEFVAEKNVRLLAKPVINDLRKKA
jgi:hypothetical protein